MQWLPGLPSEGLDGQRDTGWSAGRGLGLASIPASGLECQVARCGSVTAELRSQGDGKEAARGPQMSSW